MGTIKPNKWRVRRAICCWGNNAMEIKLAIYIYTFIYIHIYIYIFIYFEIINMYIYTLEEMQ